MFIQYNDGAHLNCDNFDICVVDGIYDEDENETLLGYGVFFVRRNAEKTDAVCVYECVEEGFSKADLKKRAVAMCEQIQWSWFNGEKVFGIDDASPVDEPLFSLYGVDI